MSNWVIAFFAAAGVSGWTYSKMGKRIGYGNSQNVWGTIAVVFVLVFAFFVTLLHYAIHLGN